MKYNVSIPDDFNTNIRRPIMNKDCNEMLDRHNTADSFALTESNYLWLKASYRSL